MSRAYMLHVPRPWYGCHACMYVCLFNGQQTKFCFMQIHLVNILLLREQYLMNLPDACPSQLSKKSDTEQAH